MGIRETQIYGLTEEAQTFLQDNVKLKENLCPHCNGVLSQSLDSTVYDSAAHIGMFADGPDLHEYKLSDGSTVREVVQAIEWSSGPCIFLCLDVDGKRLFEWPSEQIAAA